VETVEKKQIGNKKLKWIIISAIPIVTIILYFVLSSSKNMADLAVKYFSRPIRDFLGTICSFVKFSVMELMYVLLAAFLIYYVVKTVILLIKRDKKLLTLGKRLGILILVVLYILGGYLALWGIDYKSSSFSDKEGFSISGITTDDLYETTKYFVQNTVALADTVERDENGHFNEDMDNYFELSTHVYDNLEGRFQSLNAKTRVPKKMIFSIIMSKTGFTGVYFPFTGESNINIDNTASFIPFTIAHELTHQRGVYSEQECNFLGVAACVTSDLDVYRYSGFLSGTVYLMNALYKASPEKWKELYSTFSGNMIVDWNDNNEYWNSMKSQITTVSESVYDTYLKANGQTSGIKSYGACIDLLVTYYINGGLN
jgi:hypothetical protein